MQRSCSCSRILHRRYTRKLLQSHPNLSTHRRCIATEQNASEYTQIEWYNKCVDDSVSFWRDAAKGIEWHKFPETIFKPHDEKQQLNYSWFSDGELNITISMLDRHIANGNGNATAIIYDSPLTKQSQYMTYNELLELVENCSAYLANCGVGKGDVVMVYMPMIPEALIAMYAIARIGAIHAVVFGGFAGPELAKRIIDCQPKVIISASGGKESEHKIVEYKPMLDEAIELTPDTMKPAHILLKQRSEVCFAKQTYHFEQDWDAEVVHCKYDRKKDGKAVIMKATDPLYILYTSGTTGTPKGIIRECGGYAVALQWTMKHFYAGNAGDVVMFGSDIGWVVGHSYIAYGQLLSGATTVLFEGKPVGMPQDGAGTYWRLIEEHNIKSLFSAPTAIRAIRKEDPYGELMKKYDISCLQNLFLAGERCDPNTMEWIQGLLSGNDSVVTDHWWQTETGYPITGTMLGDAIRKRLEPTLGSGGMPIPGMILKCVPPLTASSDDDKQMKSMPLRMIESVGVDETGELILKLPLPPGTLGGVWNNPARTFEAYLERYPGYYCTGDTGFRDGAGFIHIMSRVDDIINVAGHRLSTASMEQVIAEHECIAESAVIGVAHILKGEVPVGVVVKKQGFEHIRDDVVENEIKMKIRKQIGAVASYQETIIVDKLPKTRSGKILRRSLKDIYNTEEIASVPATIEDAEALTHFQHNLLAFRERKSSQMVA